MIVFRQRYPRWWFDFALELTRFGARVCAFLVLLTDQYPSTVEEQSVHLQIDYPDVERDLNRWLPLVKWLLAIPHFLVLKGRDAAPGHHDTPQHVEFRHMVELGIVYMWTAVDVTIDEATGSCCELPLSRSPSLRGGVG